MTKLTCALSLTLSGVLAAGVLTPLNHARAASPRQPAESATVVYEARTASDFAAWRTQGGYSFSGGGFTFDGVSHSGSSDAMAPYTTRPLTSFAVEATIVLKRVTQDPKTHDHEAVPFARYLWGHPFTGVYGGPRWFSDTGVSQSQLAWQHQDPAPNAPGATMPEKYLYGKFAPQTGVSHVYRIEVRGRTHYRVLIDGRIAVPWTTITDFKTDYNIGTTGFNIGYTLTDFKLIKLGKGTAAHPLDAPAYEARQLTAMDVGLPPRVAFFNSNVSEAATGGSSVATYKSQGRVFDYYVSHSNNVDTDFNTEYVVYTTPENARLGFEHGRTRDLATYAKNANFRLISTTGAGLGEQSFGYSYTYSDRGRAFTEIGYEFLRGTYAAYLWIDAVSASTPDRILALARLLDTRLSS